MFMATFTPGTGTIPTCPQGSFWSPNEGRCVSLYTPASYEPMPNPPQDPSIPQPVDPYGPDYMPPNLPEPVSSSGSYKKWILIGSFALAAVGGAVIVYSASRRRRR